MVPCLSYFWLTSQMIQVHSLMQLILKQRGECWSPLLDFHCILQLRVREKSCPFWQTSQMKKVFSLMKLILQKWGEGRPPLLSFRHSPQFRMFDQNDPFLNKSFIFGIMSNQFIPPLPCQKILQLCLSNPKFTPSMEFLAQKNAHLIIDEPTIQTTFSLPV